MIGDGALGFWKALPKVFPESRGQRCWVHKIANVLAKRPKSMQPKGKASLHNIMLAENRDTAYKAFDDTVKLYEAKYPEAMQCLLKDKDAMLAFYEYSAEHWRHIRTTHPIESTFSTVRLRTNNTRNCVSRERLVFLLQHPFTDDKFVNLVESLSVFQI